MVKLIVVFQQCYENALKKEMSEAFEMVMVSESYVHLSPVSAFEPVNDFHET